MVSVQTKFLNITNLKMVGGISNYICQHLWHIKLKLDYNLTVIPCMIMWLSFKFSTHRERESGVTITVL